MRIIGAVTQHSNATISLRTLQEAMLLKPEIIYNVSNLFEKNETVFSSFLGRKGLTMGGLYADAKGTGFQVVGNRQVKWPLKGYEERKGKVLETVPGTPGLNQATFTLTLDTDWFDKNEILDLWDRRTLLFIHDKQRSSTPGAWNYTVQLMSNEVGAFVNPRLLVAGSEVGFSYTAYPELSEDGNEKYTHPEWHTEFMTIQRMKFSISGSAAAQSGYVLEHNGKKLFASSAYLQMLKRFMRARENQLLFAKATVDANSNVYLKDLETGKDIVAGNGLMHQGDPSMKFSYSNLSMKWLDNMMDNMDLMATEDGVGEIVIAGGQTFINQFHRLMTQVLGQNPEPLVEGSGNDKVINTNFSAYVHNGIRLTPMRLRAFDYQLRPNQSDVWGQNYGSRMGFALNLGNTIGGEGSIRLMALGNSDEDRRFVQKEVIGMSGGGAKNSKSERIMSSSSVDGHQVHVLCESGVALMNPFHFAEIVPTMRKNQ